MFESFWSNAPLGTLPWRSTSRDIIDANDRSIGLARTAEIEARIVASVNFCRNLPLDMMEGRKLVSTFSGQLTNEMRLLCAVPLIAKEQHHE